jgi:hypothetical protein
MYNTVQNLLKFLGILLHTREYPAPPMLRVGSVEAAESIRSVAALGKSR